MIFQTRFKFAVTDSLRPSYSFYFLRAAACVLFIFCRIATASVVALVVSSFCSVLALSVLDVSVVSGFMPSTSTISSMQAFSNSTASPAFAWNETFGSSIVT